jgi:molybdate transport system substrate-binding protein
MKLNIESPTQTTVGARRPSPLGVSLASRQHVLPSRTTLFGQTIGLFVSWANTRFAPTRRYFFVGAMLIIAQRFRDVYFGQFLVLILSFPMQSVTSHAQDKTLTVFAASSLTEAFTELGQSYQKQTGVKVRFQFAGSQILRTQLENGAPADVLATAELSINTMLEQKKILEKNQIFAQNRLVVITPKSGVARVKTLADLVIPNVKLVIAQANVPIGVYTRQVLQKLEATKRYGADFSSRVLKNVVSEESNVRQVALKVRLGEADAGIVYVTDVTPEVRSQLIQIAIPERQNVIAQYPIGVLSNSKNLSSAREFMQYVLSPTGQGILQQWGFLKKP